MEAILNNKISKNLIKVWIFDLSAIIVIYLIPTFSHLLALPIYFIEPMRSMLILALVHTSKQNAYLLAATLPVFSFLISAHPVFLKTLLISSELLFNVWLFFYLSQKMKNKFGVMVLSIAISKIAYYLIKFGLLSFVLLEGNLVSTPIFIQIITTILFGSYIYFMKNNIAK